MDCNYVQIETQRGVEPCRIRPRYIYVERSVKEYPIVANIEQRFPEARVYEIDDHRMLHNAEVPLKGISRVVKNQVLVMARTEGQFVRPFASLCSTNGPKEFFIAHANGCPFDCEYCFLQAYVSHSAPVVFANKEDLFDELEGHLRQAAPGTRYHAGELSDAIVLEPLTGFASQVIAVFSSYPHVSLELRTKCTQVAEVLPRDPPPNVVISWTLTPVEVASTVEHGAPCVEKRIESAVQCRKMGYRVGFRLDPLIRCTGWEYRYAELIEMIFSAMPPNQVDSIVMGAFRYSPALASKIRERFPASPLLLDEFVMCGDGKFRYFRPLRTAMYRTILSEIRRFSEEVPVALCMETSEVAAEIGLLEGYRPGVTRIPS